MASSLRKKVEQFIELLHVIVEERETIYQFR
jgi:hypothetical protein